jgi:ABC-type branched-subunit amino acid transport system substrate-binding protein
MVATACGARVPPLLSVAASGPSGNVPGQSSGPNQSTTTTVVGRAGTSARTIVTGGSGGHSVGGSSGKGSTGGTGSSGQNPSTPQAASAFNFNPQAEASYCTGTAGNTASAPGVTPTSINVGNVSGLTGAVSDSFSVGPPSVTALFKSINQFGGICGRQLNLQTEDDQQSSSSNASDVQFLIPKVLAFVGSLSDADNGGVPAMTSAGVPDLGPAINANRSNSPVYWSATGGSVTIRNGHAFLYNTALNGAKQYGDLPKNICILAYSIAISAQAAQQFAALYRQYGVPIPYTNYGIPPAPGATMGSVVNAMKKAGCQGVFTTMDIVGNAQMLQDMQDIGWRPPNISTTYEGYSPQQISLAGQGAAQGLQVGLNSVPLTESSNPGIALFEQEMGTWEPSTPLTEFGLEAWADAQLFVYTLLKAGRNPTRASITSALQGVINFTMDTAFGPYTPNQRTGGVCSVNVVVQGNGFARQWPPSGLYCNGQLIDVGPAS